MSDSCAGTVCKDEVFIVGDKCDPLTGSNINLSDSAAETASTTAALYKYNFCCHTWDSLDVPNNPAFSQRSLMVAHGDELIMYGE